VVAKQIALYPSNGLWSLVFCILVLICSRLAPSVGSAILAILTVQAEVFLFQGVGLLISAGVPMSGLVVVSVVCVTYFFAFNGFFSPFALMAPWYGWLRWTCFLTYSYQLVMRIVFPFSEEFECSPAPALSGYPACDNGTKISGADVLEHYAIDLSVATCLSVILCAGIFFRLMAYLIYIRRMTPPRGIADSQQRRSLCGCCRRSKSKNEGPAQKSGVSTTHNVEVREIQTV